MITIPQAHIFYGNDITHLYEIITANDSKYHSKLTITRRTITVKTYSYVGIYTGQGVKYEAYEVLEATDTTGLIDSHEFVVLSFAESKSLNKKVLNTITYDIFDEYGNSVKKNYDVKTEFGYILLVNKLEINLSNTRLSNLNLTPKVLYSSGSSDKNLTFEINDYYIIDANGIVYDSINDIEVKGSYNVVVTSYTFSYYGTTIDLDSLNPTNEYTSDGIVLKLQVI